MGAGGEIGRSKPERETGCGAGEDAAEGGRCAAGDGPG